MFLFLPNSPSRPSLALSFSPSRKAVCTIPRQRKKAISSHLIDPSSFALFPKNSNWPSPNQACYHYIFLLFLVRRRVDLGQNGNLPSLSPRLWGRTKEEENMANSDWPSVDPSLWLGATLPRPFEEIIGWGEREAWDSPKKPFIFRSLVKLPLYNPQKKESLIRVRRIPHSHTWTRIQ